MNRRINNSFTWGWNLVSILKNPNGMSKLAFKSLTHLRKSAFFQWLLMIQGHQSFKLPIEWHNKGWDKNTIFLDNKRGGMFEKHGGIFFQTYLFFNVILLLVYIALYSVGSAEAVSLARVTIPDGSPLKCRILDWVCGNLECVQGAGDNSPLCEGHCGIVLTYGNKN